MKPTKVMRISMSVMIQSSNTEYLICTFAYTLFSSNDAKLEVFPSETLRGAVDNSRLNIFGKALIISFLHNCREEFMSLTVSSNQVAVRVPKDASLESKELLSKKLQQIFEHTKNALVKAT